MIPAFGIKKLPLDHSGSRSESECMDYCSNNNRNTKLNKATVSMIPMTIK